MDNATHLGLDVHKDTIAVAVLRPGEAEPDERTIANSPEALRTLIRRGSFEHAAVQDDAMDYTNLTGDRTFERKSGRRSA